MGEEKFGRLESIDIEIEWDEPVPETVIIHRFNPQETVWHKRLSPLRRHPGRVARVKRDIRTARQANTIAYNIKRAVRNHNPREDWLVQFRKCDDGTWGVWVTYLGVMSEEELIEREKIRAQRGAEVKRRKRVKQFKDAEALARGRVTQSLRPPVWEPD